MAVEPFDCERCGRRHERCKGHVVICPVCVPDRDRRPEARPLQVGDPCLRCETPCIERDCHRWPRPTQAVCPSHGGNAVAALVKAAERGKVARIRAVHAEVCDEIGLSRDIDPGDALIELVREAGANVEFYRLLVQDLPVHPGDDALVPGDEGTRFVQGNPGIYGRTYHQSGIATGEAKRNILLTLYDDERDRLAKYSDFALKAGVEERRVRLAEADAREFFAGIAEAITAAALTPEQTEIFRATLIARFNQFRGAGHAGGSAGPAPADAVES